MKKAFRITRYILLTLLGLIFALWLMLQTPAFQNWLVKTATNKLSKSLGTTVKVTSAYIGWLNRVTLEGVYVADQQKDTLLSVGRLQMNTTDWLVFKDTVVLKYLSLKDVKIRLSRTDSIWNYAFISKALAGDGKKDPAVTTAAGPAGNPVVFQLEIIEVENLRFLQLDKWRGKSMLAGIAAMQLKANEFDLNKQKFDIEKIVLQQPEYRELRRNGLWSAADSTAYWRRIDSLDRLRTYPESWNPDGMSLLVRNLEMKEGVVEIYNRRNTPFVRGEFDETDIIIHPISGVFKNIKLTNDTLTAYASINAKERSGLNIKKLETNFRMHPQLMEFSDMDLLLNESRLGPYYAMRYRSLDKMEYFVDSVRITARMKNSTINLHDLTFFAPELKGMNQIAQLSGDAEGTVSDFIVKNVLLETGKSKLTGTYSMKGLIDIDKTVIKFNTPASNIALEDVAVWAPQLVQLKNTPVSNLGVVTYAGNFEGTIYDFAAKGKLQTAVGNMDAALQMRLAGKQQGFEAVISNANIHAGRLLNVPDLGQAKFDGKVKSNGFSAKNPLLVEGDIASVQYGTYTYHNISMDGQFVNSKLDANLSASDSNLTANFTTQLNFKEKSQGYNARGAIAFADLRALGFTKDSIRVSGLFDVDFRGKRVDDFVGYARIYDAELYDASELLDVDSFLVTSEIDEIGTKTLTLETNEAYAKIVGKFNLSDLPNGFSEFLHQYYPSVIAAPKTIAKDQELTFNIETRNVEPFLHFISPKLRGLNFSNLTGSLNTNTSELLVNLDAPLFEYDGISLTSTSLRASGSTNELRLSGSIDNIRVNDSISFPNVKLLVNTSNDTTQIKINTNAEGPLGNAAINGFFYSKPTGFEAKFEESSFILNNKLWTLSSTGSVEMKNGYLIANGVELSSSNQRILMYTIPSDEGNWNDAYVDITEFNLGDVLPFVLTEPRLEGSLSGRVVVEDPMGRQFIHADLKAKEFLFNNDSVGVVALKGTYNTVDKKLRATIDSENPEYDFSSALLLDLSDSARNQINANIVLRNERISVLQNYLGDIFNKLDGYASGNISIIGKLNAPSILGEAKLTGGLVEVAYTGCTYRIDSANIKFGDNYLDFGTLKLTDVKGRNGTMEGIMYHRFFDSLSFNMKMRTNGMQLLNTTAKDNDLFYGSAVGQGSFELVGPLNNLNMRIAALTTDSSHIIIANKTSKESGEADFIVFKKYGIELKDEADSNATNIHISLDLTATPLCQIDVVMDEITGDVIKATGSGNLKIRTGSFEETSMRGRYQIEKGSYNYSFQTLIRKPFELEGGDNSYIEWTGDPFDANLNISARYTANNVSMKDLTGSDQGQSILDQNAQNYKGDVYVKARLTGILSKPDISFDIAFPQGSPMQNNVSAQQMLRQIANDKSEMLRQVTYLIVFKSFAPYKEGTGTRNPGADFAVNTISDLLSNQMGKILTNVVQEITGDRSLNVDFSTELYNSTSLVSGDVNASTGYDRVNFNFMLNKSYFNNRVMVNLGSDFDLNVRNTTTSGFQFLPDVSVEFILTQNRRLRAIVFKKDNLDYAGRRNRAGISLSYRKDYEKFISANKDDALIFLKKEGK